MHVISRQTGNVHTESSEELILAGKIQQYLNQHGSQFVSPGMIYQDSLESRRLIISDSPDLDSIQTI